MGPARNLGRHAPEVIHRDAQGEHGVLHKGKNLPIDKTGRYEFVYLVGPSVKQGAFVYLEDRPTAAGLVVGPFKVPWK